MVNSLLDRWRCRRTVRAWQHRRRRQARQQAALACLEALPYSALIGDILYHVGFLVEYAAVCAGRRLRAALRLLAGALGGLLLLLLRPLLVWLVTLAEGTAHPPTPRRLLGLAAPAAAALWLVLLVQRGISRHYVLQVQVNGVVVGCVASEQVFDSAREDVQRRIASAGLAAQWSLWPTYTLTTAGETLTESELANAILRASSDSLCDATAVYVDGDLRFVTDEGDHLRSYLARLQTPYLETLDPNGRVGFVHEIRLEDGVYLPQSVVGLKDVLADPELYQIKTVVRQVRLVDIPYGTVYTDSPEYLLGQTVTAQEGALGVQEVTEDITFIEGSVADITVVDSQTVQEPVDELILRGTGLKPGLVAQVEGGSFIWPVPDFRGVSRWMDSGHLGADIYALYGTPIYASAGGTVLVAGWHNSPYSYGNYVKIDHGNGYTTLYGHMSSYVVSAGDVVEQGQLIGYVGDTGYSFGNHCHFEMAYNGVRFDAHALFPTIPTG